MVGLRRRGRSGCGLPSFSLIRRCRLCFLFCFSSISFWHDCDVFPSGGLNVVSVGFYINIAGRKPISSIIIAAKVYRMVYFYLLEDKTKNQSHLLNFRVFKSTHALVFKTV